MDRANRSRGRSRYQGLVGTGRGLVIRVTHVTRGVASHHHDRLALVHVTERGGFHDLPHPQALGLVVRVHGGHVGSRAALAVPAKGRSLMVSQVHRGDGRSTMDLPT
jgi:hypothetical protein